MRTRVKEMRIARMEAAAQAAIIAEATNMVALMDALDQAVAQAKEAGLNDETIRDTIDRWMKGL